MSIKKVITELLTNSYIKNILLSVLSGFFGVCSGIVSSAIYSNSYTTTFVVFTILGITALIITIALNVFYIKSDKSIKNSSVILDAFTGFGDEFESSSEKLYSVINKARTNNILSLDAWNKSVEFDFICDNLYKLVCQLADKGDNFSVSIIIKVIDPADKITKYMMISRKAKNRDKPRIYKTPVLQAEAEKYYYGKLFKASNPAPSYLMSAEDVRKNFYFRKKTSNPNKYSQYIGIPICCKGDEMSGLIQIIGHEGSILSKDISKIEEIVNKTVFVYANFGLFCEKIEKGLLVKPANKSK